MSTNKTNKIKKTKKLKAVQKLILIMAIIMISTNAILVFLIKNVTEKTLIETEHRYLTEIVKNIANSTEKTVLEFMTISEILAKNSNFIQLLKDSDQENIMIEHHLVDIVVEEMANVCDSYNGGITNIIIGDKEQNSFVSNTGDESNKDFSLSSRPYYSTVNTGEPVITEPYLDVITGSLVTTIATPVFDSENKNEVLGLVGFDLPIDFVSNLVLDSSYGTTGRCLVLDEYNKIIAYSDTNYINKNLTELGITGEYFYSELENPTGKLIEYQIFGELKMGMVIDIDFLGWKIITGMDYSEFDQITPIIVLSLVVSTLLTFFVCSITVSGKFSEEILDINQKDTLTSCYSRAGFSAKVDAISNAKSIGVISVNINGLKKINELDGIKQGDIFIKACVKQLKEHFGYEMFRMSGNEFIIVATDVEKDLFEEKVENMYESMRVAQNYDLSIGHAYGKNNLSNLMYEAETLMYINKQKYYASNPQRLSQIDNVILAELLTYLANDEFMVYLQPQVHIKDGTLYGAEALIRRFDKKNQKMVFPDQFIPVYEQKSIIRHVDLFVIDTVCKLLSKWTKIGKAIPVSVNLSRVTLQEHSIVYDIMAICDSYNVPHELLVIEVTERVGLVENNVASTLVREFKDNGFYISLDDFGCAYSNIVTLAQIEVDEIKIDKSLVDDLIINNKNYVLVKNVLSMCNELGETSTLAEGIESKEQANLLHELGCHLGQGYYYSRPIPVKEFEEKYINNEGVLVNDK